MFGKIKNSVTSKLSSDDKDNEGIDWIFDCTKLTSSGDKSGIDGKLVIERNGKDSRFYFKAKDTAQEENISLDSLNFETIGDKKRKMGIAKSKQNFKLTQPSSGGAIQSSEDLLFNISHPDEFQYYLKKIYDEMEYEDYEFIANTKSGEKIIPLNLHYPYMHEDKNEEKLCGMIPQDKKLHMVLTNYRIFYYNKKYSEVINPVPLPIECHKENVRTEVVSKSSGNTYGNPEGWFGAKQNTTSKQTSMMYGDIVMFDDEGNEHARFRTVDPDDILNRIEVANRRLAKKESSSVHIETMHHNNYDNVKNSNIGSNISQSQVNQTDNSVNINMEINSTAINDIVESLKFAQELETLTEEQNQKITKLTQMLEEQGKSTELDKSKSKDLLNIIKNYTASLPMFAGAIEKIGQLLA